jgi:hypothetical protein
MSYTFKSFPTPNVERRTLHLCVLIFLATGLGNAQSSGLTTRKLPFSATEWITRTSKAADGTASVTIQQVNIARASDGTVRREVHEPAPGPNRTTGRPILLLSIINEDTKIDQAFINGRAATTSLATPQLTGAKSVETSQTGPKQTVSAVANRELSTLNGLQVVLHHSQYTLPVSGANSKPVAVTSDLWYSPDLRIPLKSSTSDSLGSNVTTVLEDLVRQEPDAGLFRVGAQTAPTQK